MKQLFLIACLSFCALPFPLVTQAQIEVMRKQLEVPYVAQAPDGNWTAPWNEACEEASIIMIDHFYQGTAPPDTEEIKQNIRDMVTWENKTFRKNDDTTAEETEKLIQYLDVFDTEIKRDPTVEEIKEQIDLGRPVIALLNMYTLYGEQEQGDSYHVLVINGYDDEKKEFLLQDPARADKKTSSYETVMRALHDYNPASKEADGTPTIVFTSPPAEGFNFQTFFSRIVNFFRNLF
jgi:uncharacterized protein YvpB